MRGLFLTLEKEVFLFILRKTVSLSLSETVTLEGDDEKNLQAAINHKLWEQWRGDFLDINVHGNAS